MNKENILYGSPEYLALAKGKIHASGAPVLMGVDPYRKKDEEVRKLVRSTLGLEEDTIENVAIDHQRLWELSARNQLQILLGSTIHHAYTYFYEDWLVANPSGYIKNGNVITNVRIRCPFSMRDAFEEGKEFTSIASLPHYYARLQLEMACMGVESTYFFQWSERKYLLEEVHINQKWLDFNLPKLKEIFRNIFDVEINNPIFSAPLREDVTDEKLISIIERIDVLEGEKKQLDNLINAEKQKIFDYAEENGGHNLEISGRKVTKVIREGSIKWGELAKDKLSKEDLTEEQLAKYKGKSSYHWRIS